MPASTNLISLAIIAAVCAVASGQVAPPPKLERVEPTIEDIDPLHVSLREMRIDFRQPFGFQDVYRVPGDPNKFMRTSGGLYAVFPRSVYGWSHNQLLAQVPPDTVYHIGLPPTLPSKESRPHPDRQLEDGITSSDKSPSEGRPMFRFNNRIENRVNTIQEDQVETLTSLLPEDFRSIERRELSSVRETIDGPRQAPAVETQPSNSALQSPSIISDAGYRARRIAQLLQCAAQACAAASDAGRDSARHLDENAAEKNKN